MNNTVSTYLPLILKIAGTAVLYFLSAKAVAPLSLVESGSVFAIWPPTGIALSALFLFGFRIWPGIFLGALALNLTLTPFWPSAQIAITNTLGPLIGLWLLERYSKTNIFDTTQAMVVFFLAITVASLITASGGSFTLWAHGFVPPEVVLNVWTGWFLGDLIGFMLIAPIVESLRTEQASIQRLLTIEGVMMLAVLGLSGFIIFGPHSLFDLIEYPVVYFLLPSLIWGALRFGSVVAVISLFLVALASIYGTILTYGPFLREDPNQSLFLLQSFNGMLAMTILLMAAIFRERELARAELQQHKENLEELVHDRTEELEKANKELQKLDNLKSMFIASMSHELRTPLNAIIGFTGVVLSEATGKLEAKQKDFLERTRSASRHLLHLVMEVIDISKIEANKIDTKPERFELGSIIDEAVAAVAPLSDEKKIPVTVHLDHEIELNADRVMLKQCIENFLNNALKYSEEGEVTLNATEDEGTVTISVTDRGIGIAEEEQERIFKAFERLDSPLKVVAGGTGLGLYLTKKIVEEVLGGEIFLESKIGIGRTFGLRRPKTSV